MTLGVCFGAPGIAFFTLGSNRNRQIRRHLVEGGFEPLSDRVVFAVTVALFVLGLAEMVLLILES